MPDQNTVLLLGVVGSRAYGMAMPASDVDTLGVFAVPTARLHGLHPPTAQEDTIHTTSCDVDVTLHEARKFATLALGGNPTAMELLWLDQYEVRTTLGDELVGMRERMLCRKRVADAYFGYADQQFRRLVKAGRFPDVPASRVAKHARHLLRLVEQGTHLWVTGKLVLRVPDAQRVRDFGDRVADGNLLAARLVLQRARQTFDDVVSPLPDEPDRDAVEAWLLRVRAWHYHPPIVDTHPARV